MPELGVYRPRLVKALLDAIGPQDIGVLAVMVGTSIENIAPPNATLPNQIAALVVWAERHSCQAMLVREAMARNKDNIELAAIGPAVLEHLERMVPWYTAPHPIETLIVSRDQAFIDRLELRQRVQQMMAAKGWNSLAVSGEKRSGRSFTLEFIAFMVGSDETSRIVHIDLKDTSPDIGPGGVVRLIALQMTLDVNTIPQQDAQAANWNDELRSWVIGQVENGTRTCWLVIDAIDDVRPSAATMDLIWKLAAAAKTSSKLRVVLLACSEPPPEGVDPLEERIEPISRDMLDAFFTLFYTHKGVEPTAKRVREATTLALRGVPARSPKRLKLLQQQVATVAKSIAEETT
jgi:hypothetical protein